MTGIYYDAATGDWAIEVEAAGGVCGYAPTAEEAAKRLGEELARWGRHHRDRRDDEGMHMAFGRFLGCVIESREVLSGGEWMLPGDAMKFQR
jgi:flavin-dependent dehydrogenase